MLQQGLSGLLPKCFEKFLKRHSDQHHEQLDNLRYQILIEGKKMFESYSGINKYLFNSNQEIDNGKKGNSKKEKKKEKKEQRKEKKKGRRRYKNNHDENQTFAKPGKIVERIDVCTIFEDRKKRRKL